MTDQRLSDEREQRRAVEAQAAPAEAATGLKRWPISAEIERLKAEIEARSDLIADLYAENARLSAERARGPALTPAEIEVLADLVGSFISEREQIGVGVNPTIEALRAKLRALVGE